MASMIEVAVCCMLAVIDYTPPPHRPPEFIVEQMDEDRNEEDHDDTDAASR